MLQGLIPPPSPYIKELRKREAEAKEQREREYLAQVVDEEATARERKDAYFKSKLRAFQVAARRTDPQQARRDPAPPKKREKRPKATFLDK